MFSIMTSMPKSQWFNHDFVKAIRYNFCKITSNHYITYTKSP